MHVEWPDVLAQCGVVTGPDDLVIITEADPLDFPGPRIVHVNAAFERATGFTASEVLGKTPRLLQGARTCRHTLDALRAALEAGRASHVRLTNYRSDGTPFEADVSITPLASDDGAPGHWVSVQRDVTAQVLGEALMRSDMPPEMLLGAVGTELLLHTGAACGVAAHRSSAARAWTRRPLQRVAGGTAVEGDRALVDAALAVLAMRLGASARASIATTGAEMAKRGAAVRCRDGSELAVVLMLPRGQAWPVADHLLAPVVQRIGWALDARGTAGAPPPGVPALR